MHGIELRRRSGSGSGLLRQTANDVQDRGARGFFGLSGDGGGDSADRREQKWPPRLRRRVVFIISALASLALVVALVVIHHHRQPKHRPHPRTFSFPEKNEKSLPPPSALCSPADASTRLEFFSDLGGFSFPTATTSTLSDDVESEGEGGEEGGTSARNAQKLIDQGWLLYRGFHRSAAVAAFSAALELSDNMSSGAALGLSWSLGPGANLVAVDSPASFPAFEAGRDFPLASEAARRALELAEKAAEEEEEEERKRQGDDRDHRRRLRKSFLVQRDLALARAAAKRFAPGTARGRARKRAEAEAAAAVEEVARRGGSLRPPPSDFGLPDPALLSLAAELRVHESQWDYWELPLPFSRAGERCRNADCLSFAHGGGKSSNGSATGWPSSSLALKLKPHAEKAAELVRESLRIDPREPLALHLAVHLSEAAPPAQAAALGLSAADALAGLDDVAGGGGEEGDRERRRWRGRAAGVPDEALEAAEAAEREGTSLLPSPSPSSREKKETPWALGHVAHLLHMPVHLYTRVGAYSDAVSAGIAASSADDALASRCIESYAVEHNAAALVFAANLAGRRKISAQQIEQRLARSSRVLGPAMSYAEGTLEVTLGISTEVLFADWGGIRERRRRKELERLEVEGEERRRQQWWRFWAKRQEPLLLSSKKERGLCVSGGAAFAHAMFSAASALELAARADEEAKGSFPPPSSVSFETADAAIATAERLASSLPLEPQTHPGGGPGIYACGHREVARGLVALAKARLLLAKGGGEEKNDGGNGDENASAAAAAAAAKLLEPHERLQFNAPYMEPPRSQVPLAPCLGYLLLRSRDPSGAAEVFRRDLASRPRNGRGLLGLSLALEGMNDAAGAAAAAEQAREAFEIVWKDADGPLSSPCPALSD